MIEAVINFFREMAPAGPEIEWGAIVSCVGTAFSYLIGWNDVIEALLVAMAIDYVTGILAAYINPNLALNLQKNRHSAISGTGSRAGPCHGPAGCTIIGGVVFLRE